MSRSATRDMSLGEIVHELKDGTQVQDIAGVKVPNDHPVYEVIKGVKK